MNLSAFAVLITLIFLFSTNASRAAVAVSTDESDDSAFFIFEWIF